MIKDELLILQLEGRMWTKKDEDEDEDEDDAFFFFLLSTWTKT